MENTELHGQKLAILSRLIKESSLTLEEALVLLQDEPVEIKEEISVKTVTNGLVFNPHYNSSPSVLPVGSAIRFSSSGSFGIGTTTDSGFTLNTTADADLNN